jgi:transcriptional regulator with XRE-family HTH domain
MGILDVFIINLKKYRKSAGITQERLAELCRTDTAYIGQIETGRRCPSLEYVERIASALNIAPYQLFYSDSAGDTAADPRRLQKEKIKAMLNDNFSRICAIIDEEY